MFTSNIQQFLTTLTLAFGLATCISSNACSDDATPSQPDAAVTPDAPASVDAPPGCDPQTVLPSKYRPIPLVSEGLLAITVSNNISTGTIDATAGGIANSADRPYIYIDLRNGRKVEVTDLASRSSMDWDIALKRSSLRSNSGDSGAGNRKVAVVAATDLTTVTVGPASGYTTDDFTSADCMFTGIPGGEPQSVFAEWYNYDQATNQLSPKPEVYVVERSDGSRSAFRIVTYYGDPASAMRGAFYRVEFKALPNR